MKLMMSDWKVDLVNDCVNDFTVLFKGPPDSEFLPVSMLRLDEPQRFAIFARRCCRGFNAAHAPLSCTVCESSVPPRKSSQKEF